MVQERLPFGKYLTVGVDITARIEESKANLSSILADPWEKIAAQLQRIWSPEKVATLTTLASLEQSPNEILQRVLAIVPPERTVYQYDLAEYVPHLKPFRPHLWLRIWAHAGEAQNGLIIVKGFEKYHEHYDTLLLELVDGVDVYGNSPYDEFKDYPAVLVLTDLTFLAYLNACNVSNIAGYKGRGDIFVVKGNPPDQSKA